MVTESDRGQIILVGAVVIALAILGFVFVLNTSVYAEEVASSSAAEARDSLNGLDQEVFRDSKSVLLRSNHVDRYNGRSDLNETVDGNFANYSRLLTESYTDSSSGFVEVEYVGNETIYGNRLLQGGERNFSGPTGAADWQVTDRQTEVGWFVMNVNVSNGTDTNFGLNVSNDDAEEYVQYTLDRKDATGKLVIDATYRADGTTDSSQTTCDAPNDRVLIDFVNGSVYDEECSLPPIADVEPPYVVEITDGDQVKGLFELVVEDPTTVSGTACTPGATRCVSPAVWQTSVSLYYDTQKTTYVDKQYVRPYVTDEKPLRGSLVSGTAIIDGTAGDSGDSVPILGRHNKTNTRVLGPPTANLTGDYRNELPYVDSTGSLMLVDRNNVTTQIAPPGTARGATTPALLAVDRWESARPSVLFADGASDELRQWFQNGTTRTVVDPGDGVAGVAGVADIDTDDPAPELAFVSASFELQYVDDDGSVRSTGVTSLGSGVGAGVGPPTDFDGDGTAAVPFVTSAQEVAIYEDGEGKTTLTSLGSVAKAPVTTVDIDGDGSSEIVFVGTGDQLKYVDDVAGTPTVTALETPDGSDLPGNTQTGVVAG